jgi:NAD(P)H-dependent nitrite reductase small subunit
MIKNPDGFTKICKLADLKEESGKQFFVDDVEIAVFKVQGEVFALSNICPHQKTHLMHEGFIENDYVGCPVHGWMFNLKTGNLPQGRRGLIPYEVIVDGANVYVKVIKKELNW